MTQTHPDPETVASYVLGELDKAEAESIRTHLEECGRCQAEATLAREHVATAPNTDLGPRSDELRRRFDSALAEREHAGAGRRRFLMPATRPRRLAVLLATAALVVAAVGLHTFPRVLGPPQPSGELLSARDATSSEPAVQELADGWRVSWPQAGQTNSPELQVESSAGTTVYLAESSDGSWTIRREDLQDYDPDEIYFARVSAVDSTGRRIRSDPRLLP
jgi:anti-sigma factor RsiW